MYVNVKKIDAFQIKIDLYGINIVFLCIMADNDTTHPVIT